MTKVIAMIAGVYFLIVGLAFAQEYPRAEVFGGYSYLHIDTQGVTGASLDADCNLIVPGLCPPGTFHVHTGFNGWNAAGQANANRWLGIKADFSGHYGKPVTLSGDAQAILNQLGITGFPPSASSYSFLFGPVISQRFERYTGFGHALFGLNRIGTTIPTQNLGGFAIPGFTLSDSAFAMAFGGGVDVKVAPRFSLRGEADYLYAGHDFSGGVKGIAAHQNNLRASAGIVYSFGGTRHDAKSAKVAKAQHGETPNTTLPALGVVVSLGSGEGAEITEVFPGGAAAAAGLNPGDVINSVDGKHVKSPAELAAELSSRTAGDKVQLDYLHRAWTLKAVVTLGGK